MIEGTRVYFTKEKTRRLTTERHYIATITTLHVQAQFKLTTDEVLTAPTTKRD